MSDIFASLAAGTARPTATQGSGETVVRVVDPSPDLARLASGDSLRGTVVGGDQQGHLQVRTQIGVLTLSVPRPLPVGTEGVLQVSRVQIDRASCRERVCQYLKLSFGTA